MRSPIATWASPLRDGRLIVRLPGRKRLRHCFRVPNRPLPRPMDTALVLAVANSSVAARQSIGNERRADVVVVIMLLGIRGHDLVRLRQREVQIGIESRGGMGRRHGEGSRHRLRLHGRERREVVVVVVVDQHEEGSRRRRRGCRREKRRSRGRGHFRRSCRGLSESCLRRPLSMVTF